MLNSLSTATTGVGMLLRNSTFSKASSIAFLVAVMSTTYSSAPTTAPVSSRIGAPVYWMGMFRPCGSTTVSPVATSPLVMAWEQRHSLVWLGGVLDRASH